MYSIFQLKMKGGEERKNTSPFCYAILAKIKWQIVINWKKTSWRCLYPVKRSSPFIWIMNHSHIHSQVFTFSDTQVLINRLTLSAENCLCSGLSSGGEKYIGNPQLQRCAGLQGSLVVLVRSSLSVPPRSHTYFITFCCCTGQKATLSLQMGLVITCLASPASLPAVHGPDKFSGGTEDLSSEMKFTVSSLHCISTHEHDPVGSTWEHPTAATGS